jgi:hypothetical protein
MKRWPVVRKKEMVLRLMRENQLLSPHRWPQGAQVAHEGTITTDRLNVMWGTDKRTFGEAKNWASCHPSKPVRLMPCERQPELQNRVQIIGAGTTDRCFCPIWAAAERDAAESAILAAR